MNNIIFEEENGIAKIIINRPKALNALNSETIKELGTVINEISERDDIKVVIITGAGEKSFVAGADITEMKDLTAMQAKELSRKAQKVFSEIETMPQVVIAAVNGYALGGGCELSMCCDIRLVSSKAKFGQPEVGLGIIPGFAGTQRLPRLIGKGRAKELIFTTDMIDADEAYRIGLANKVYNPEELLQKAYEMAEKIMSKAMYAVGLAKASINNGLNMDTESSYSYENSLWTICFATEDQKEGMQAFIEKRKAILKGC
ncbi:enoyl-CoA hydratase/isomerase family protein [Clostridium estertheticum]|uniref:enoyl-CoA hydratase-related protein n=1 Tax=Clostridium estertheticum TaxID=238834 RepID=UPI001CF5615F|nr:enoyl-CoA hydratase-related protein [Clostridium estertheticum]MCB2309332.1 enoyl-CoA hydratase/isomerase family protein [Clostridium estertheticum]MCB2347746.1 enoyl-CoA hydratase/isomerase family protein [Clostridium estertheticum]MCB2352300.1 enoyl-CoA hydratase/isomerase family protein [Clostridium estertheticum]WAG45389.1 enoyl-CoA hydratase/isomerase family protein [Clostridium estertheticum]